MICSLKIYGSQENCRLSFFEGRGHLKKNEKAVLTLRPTPRVALCTTHKIVIFSVLQYLGITYLLT